MQGSNAKEVAHKKCAQPPYSQISVYKEQTSIYKSLKEVTGYAS